jgi:hypothetical protein
VTRPNLLFSGSTDSVSCTHVSMDPVPSLKLAEHESPHHRKLAHPLILLSCETPLHGEEQFSPFNNAGLLEAFLLYSEFSVHISSKTTVEFVHYPQI